MVRYEEIGSEQHVRVRQVDVRNPQSGVLDLFGVAYLEARCGSNVAFYHAAPDAAAIPGLHDAGRIGLYSGLGSRLQRKYRRICTRIKHDAYLLVIDIADADGVQTRLRHRLNLHLRIRLPGGYPIGQPIFFAAVGLEKSHDALGKVVFHIPLLQEILPDQPFTADLAAAHQEFNVVYERAGNTELLNGRDLGTHRAANTLNRQAERSPLQFQVELCSGRRTHHAEERAT